MTIYSKPQKLLLMGDFRTLLFYKKAFDNSMMIFQITRDFPREEKYALTTQMRNSSRSVCANIAEGYRKRDYVNHFVSKLTDADMENSETIVWIDFALACGYITLDVHKKLIASFEEVGRMLSHAIRNPDKFL